MKRKRVCSVALIFLLVSMPAWGASLREELDECRKVVKEAELAKCVKRLARIADVLAEANADGRLRDQWALVAKEKPRDPPDNSKADAVASEPSCLLGLCSYRPSHVLFRNSSAPNGWPSSPSPDHTPTSPVAHQPTELKFQLSFKSLLAQPTERLQLWAAYTQQSHWQILNGPVSRPFRETNYEPELFLNWVANPDSSAYKDWRLRMLGVGAVHQSNGQSNPLSRSWNRLYVQGGFTLGEDWTLLLKAWHRVKEDPVDDDNPDIADYIGRAEATVSTGKRDGFQAALRLRHSLNPSASHGSAQLDLSWPVSEKGRLRWYLQAFRGYGETMLDYNHLQTTLGGGFGILDWGL